MPLTLVQPPYTIAECHITQDEDWSDPLPIFYDGDSPTDLTGKTIEIYIRPTYDNSVLIKKLSTEDGTIVIDDAKEGLAGIFLAQSEVAALPVGTWQHFCIEVEAETDDPSILRRTERFRGPLVIHPGNVAP